MDVSKYVCTRIPFHVQAEEHRNGTINRLSIHNKNMGLASTIFVSLINLLSLNS